MAGEMNQSDVTREAFPLHFAIADELGGEVRAFDVYQGPYVHCGAKGKFWIQGCDGMDGFCQVYNERNDRLSEPFWPYWKDDANAVRETLYALSQVTQ